MDFSSLSAPSGRRRPRRPTLPQPCGEPAQSQPRSRGGPLGGAHQLRGGPSRGVLLFWPLLWPLREPQAYRSLGCPVPFRNGAPSRRLQRLSTCHGVGRRIERGFHLARGPRPLPPERLAQSTGRTFPLPLRATLGPDPPQEPCGAPRLPLSDPKAPRQRPKEDRDGPSSREE